jgi:pilus assembly protein CpaE
LVTDEKVNLVLTSLKKNHEYLILDLPHNFNSTTLAALDIADVILVVLQPEIISVRSAALIIETFGNLGYDLNKVNFILNWTFPRKGISIVEIEKLIQKKISLTIPYASDEFLHALNYGLPPMYDTPEEPIGILFEDLAMSLSKEKHRKNRPENPTQAWIRVIKRLKKRKTQI